MLSARKLPILLAIVAVALAGIAGGIWWFASQNNSQQAAIEQTQQVDQVQVTLRIDQSAIGTRVVEVETQDTDTTASGIAQVRLRFSMAEMDMGSTEVAADPVGQGRFQARGSFFSMVGEWNIEALLSHADGTETKAHFAVPIAAPGESAGPRNPLASNAETIAAGQLLYRANCATCHGDSGRGDGPAGKGLNPRPIDFTQHMAVGKHTDGQVFLWISNGVSGSAMPAFKQRLKEQEIWQLITYLRSFATPAAPTQAPATAQPAPADPIITSVEPTSAPIRQAPIAESKEPLPPLVFARQGQIWTSDGNGNSTPIASFGDQGYAEYPALSPDGSQVAFILVRQAPITAEVPLPTASLYLANLDGSNQREVWKPDNLMLSLPTWTADGKAIMLAANDSTGNQQSPLSIARFELATVTAKTVLTDALDPTISRDGKKLAFLKLSADGYTMSLHVAAPNGSNDHELLDGAAFQGLYAPRFSPDGSTIVFAAIGGPETNGKPVSSTPLDSLLAWLEPATAEAHGLPWDLWQINADGSGLKRLTTINEDLPMAAFSPDGKQIAFMGFGGFYLMASDGTGLRRLNVAGDHGGIDWRH